MTIDDESKPVLKNWQIGFGIHIDAVNLTPEGRGRIFVPKQLVSPDYDGPALREFMEETAVAWLEQVAPHLLATPNPGRDQGVS